MEGSPCRPKRNSVGTADGCPVGRCSGSLSLLPNLPSPVSAMGSLRRNEEGSASACPRPQGPRCPGRPGSLYRRELREKGGSKVGKTKRGKGTKIMAVADRHGLPVAVCIESATPHEVTLATSTLAQMTIPEAPTQNLIGDNAYDSDKLDTELRSYGIELISPHRSNRKNR